MGAWSHTSFGNDDAFDFVAEVAEDGEPAVANAFEVINFWAEDEALDHPDANVAIAAAELVAAAGGKPPAEFPDEALAVVSRIKDHKALRPDATKAMQHLLADSDLSGVWVLPEDYAKWRAVIEDLIERLK